MTPNANRYAGSATVNVNRGSMKKKSKASAPSSDAATAGQRPWRCAVTTTPRISTSASTDRSGGSNSSQAATTASAVHSTAPA
jgi:hypothetical protein